MSNKGKNDTKYEFKGKVVRNVYNSNNFKVYALDVDMEKYSFLKRTKYGNVSICGDMQELTEGIEYNIVATKENTKHGVSYRVANISRDMPATPDDTIAFLLEVLTEKQANTLYDEYPDIIDRVMSGNVDDIDFDKLHGIGKSTFDVIQRKIIDNFKLIELIGEFKGLLSLSMLRRIYDKYPSVEKLKFELLMNPYTTLTRVSGVGFKTADSIIKDLQSEGIIDFGFDIMTSVDRCLSCIVYLLTENEKEGNTKANLADIRSQCYKMVPSCAGHFAEAVKNSMIYYDKKSMDIALARTHDEEVYIADTIAFANADNGDKWDFDVSKYRNVEGFELTDEQMNAVQNVCDNKVSILNGAGGTGKSFCTQAIINMLEDLVVVF